MSNKALLTTIIILLIGIGSILVIQTNEKTPSEKVADSISSAADDIGDSFKNTAEE